MTISQSLKHSTGVYGKYHNGLSFPEDEIRQDKKCGTVLSVGVLVVFLPYFNTNSAKAYNSEQGDTRFRAYPPGTVITFTQQ